jgi:trehalose synthase
VLELVDVGERTLESYRGVAPEEILDAIARVAASLRGARILHVNATPYGGGVSELLRSVVPLLNDQGLVAHWRVVNGDEPFFEVTKVIHNGLQGGATDLADPQKAMYMATSRENARAFEEEYDFVFIHDPQPAALLPLRGKGGARWIWRCHIDTSAPNPNVWRFLRPFLVDYDAAVFTMAEFVPPDFPVSSVGIIPPAIDPASPKNMKLADGAARQILEWIGVRTDCPLVTQVSRFDPWKDPLGVVEAYRLAREEIPDLELAMVGSMALDDPEGWDFYRRVRAAAAGDPRIHVFTNLVGVGNIEVNAFQTLSRVVVQKSIREGFGLVVSEALWKGTPVVAGRAGGIPLQMADGAGGVLVEGVEECARALVDLLRDPDRARALGESGRERVRRHFLIPRLVLDELMLIARLATGTILSRGPGWPGHRDPVCGMVIEATEQTATVGGLTVRFCSNRCRSTFVATPGRYVPALAEPPGAAP